MATINHLKANIGHRNTLCIPDIWKYPDTARRHSKTVRLDRQTRHWTAGALSTDGRRIWSYNHVIGVSYANHRYSHVAFNCHRSVTTARHANAVKLVADLVLDTCPSCEGLNEARLYRLVLRARIQQKRV